MPTPGWVNSDRRTTLPAHWPQIVTATARRAVGRCEWPGWAPGRLARHAGERCGLPGTDCDHIGDRTLHDLSNTQWLCAGHHRRKTIQSRDTRSRTDRRPPERHPGLRRGN